MGRCERVERFLGHGHMNFEHLNQTHFLEFWNPIFGMKIIRMIIDYDFNSEFQQLISRTQTFMWGDKKCIMLFILVKSQSNESILDGRREYHWRNKASNINFIIPNNIIPVRTFSDELKGSFHAKIIPMLWIFCKSLEENMSMARSCCRIAP